MIQLFLFLEPRVEGSVFHETDTSREVSQQSLYFLFKITFRNNQIFPPRFSQRLSSDVLLGWFQEVWAELRRLLPHTRRSRGRPSVQGASHLLHVGLTPSSCGSR